MSTSRPTSRYSPSPVKGHSNWYVWGSVLVVVAIVCGLVIIKVSATSPSRSTNASNVATSSAIMKELSSVPTAVFNAVGVGGVGVSAAPIALKNQPALTSNGKPEVLYIGAEYCPFCAAERWASIIALARFGTWQGLYNTSSYSGDTYPNTPSFTFAKASYSSNYLSFVGVEEFTNYLNSSKSGYAPLQTPTAAQLKEISTYDTSTYNPGMPASDNGSIPFISFGNSYMSIGASYSPQLLDGSTQASIASSLSVVSDPVTVQILATANYQSAVLCQLTHNKPSNVCTSSGVRAAAAKMHLS